MCRLECSVTHDFEGAWVHFQSVQSVHFRGHCSAYELLLMLISNIRSLSSAMNLYIYNANFGA